LRNSDRFFSSIPHAIIIVQPETVLRWHRRSHPASTETHFMTWKLDYLIATVLATVVLALAASAATSNISERDQQALSQASLIYIATVRKDGNQSRAVPVWFTLSADGSAILIQTEPGSWKAKRIKRGSPVLIWIGSACGPAFIGKAEITSDAVVQNKILEDFRRKYWQNRILGVGPSRAHFDSGERVAIKITPSRDLPDSFSSAPGTPAPSLGTPASQPSKSS
jgi:hypothetical protein